MTTRGPELDRLEVLVGRWKTDGWTRDDPDRRTEIHATDAYERLPGGALLHIVDARVGDDKVDGAEIIGYDPAHASYVTQYFDSDGPTAYEATLEEDDGALVWAMRSAVSKFTGRFSDDGNTIVGRWELLDEDSAWQPWMDITLTKRTG